MRKIIPIILTVCALLAASCTDYQAQIDELQSKVDKIAGKEITVGKINAGVAALQQLVEAVQAGDVVKFYTPADGCCVVTFKKAGNVTLYNQTCNISVAEFSGAYYWKLGGEWITDGSAEKVPVSTLPQFRVSDYSLQMSVDGGNTWNSIPAVDDSVFVRIEDDASYLHITLVGGQKLDIPKNVPLAVAFSGDGSTFAVSGVVEVEYCISGDTGDYTVTPVAGEGWTATVVKENEFKGTIKFVAPAEPVGSTVQIMVSDGMGHMVASEIELASLTVNEDFPVMYPTWEAYNVGYEGGPVEVKLNTNLEYELALEDAASEWLSVGLTRVVREESVFFTAKANDATSMRSAQVTFTSGAYIKKVLIWQDAKQPAIGDNLSANGTANCYIVTDEGDYYFDAKVAGNGPAGVFPVLDFPETAALAPATTNLSNKVEVLTNQNNVVSNAQLSADGIVSFHASGAEGNAVIAVKNLRGKIIWSWHIWCTDLPKDRTHTNPDMVQFTVMDRNLGATSADAADGEQTHGMYYQWGRKDPFTADVMLNGMKTNSSQSFLFATQNPDYACLEVSNGNWYKGTMVNNYLWGNPDYQKTMDLADIHKSIYDPCPLGYMVPPSNTFLIFGDESRVEYLDNGILVRGDYGQTNFYPFAGRAYRSFGRIGVEVTLWHSCAARYSIYDDDGGACTRLSMVDNRIYWFYGDMRSRGIPVRCVKQVSE